MKYLKKFEQNIDGPEIGDYVVCEEYEDVFGLSVEARNFISSSIGRYIIDRAAENNSTPANGKYSFFKYLIKYKNIPFEISDFFIDDSKDNCRKMSIDEIVYWSKNEIDCEAFLASKKYNL